MLSLILIGALAILWLVSLVQVLTNADRYRNASQLIWVLVLLLTGPIGAIAFQILGPIRSNPDVDALVQQQRDREKLLS